MPQTAIPTKPEELEELLHDPTRMRELATQPDGFKALVANYSRNMLKDGEIGKQIQQGLRDGLKEFSERTETPLKRLPMGGDGASAHSVMNQVYKDLGLNREQRRQIAATGREPGQKLVGRWDNLGDFLIDAAAALVPEIRGRIGATQKDMSESILGDGGALIPPEFRAELLQLAIESAVVRPRARVIPMGSAAVSIPAIRDTTHASTVFGGISASWISEAASLSTVTQPTFSRVQLVARKLTGYTVASNELLADSAISLESIIMALFGQAIAYFEDDAFIQGTGVGQPLGLLNANALVTVAKEAGQALNTINYQNIVKMYSRVLPQSHSRLVWLVHPDTFPQLAQLALNIGTGGSAVWISNVAGGPPGTIFGQPIIVTEKAQTVGTAGDIMCVDMGYYLIGDRQSLAVMASPHVNFTTDEMAWRFVQRVDGQPWLLSALTPRRGSNTLSPFVNLATRA